MNTKYSAESDKMLNEIFRDRPQIHRSETETNRPINAKESSLSAAAIKALESGKGECYGIGFEVACFTANQVNNSSKSLEIGSGLSTLIFAVRQSSHVCVTPSRTERDGLQASLCKSKVH